jgi:hypothetical protein
MVPANTTIASVGVLLPISCFPFFPFFRSFFSSLPGEDPAIHAEASLAQCFPPSTCTRHSAWTTGSSPVVTSQKVAWPWRVIARVLKNASRERESIFTSPRGGEVAPKALVRGFGVLIMNSVPPSP